MIVNFLQNVTYNIELNPKIFQGFCSFSKRFLKQCYFSPYKKRDSVINNSFSKTNKIFLFLQGIDLVAQVILVLQLLFQRLHNVSRLSRPVDLASTTVIGKGPKSFVHALPKKYVRLS